MPVIRGRITPPVDPETILKGWPERQNGAFAPTADLHTDGASFGIEYDKVWDVNSLKHIFEIEVHRILMDAQITWL